MFGKRNISPSQYTKSSVLVENLTCFNPNQIIIIFVFRFFTYEMKSKMKIKVEIRFITKNKEKWVLGRVYYNVLFFWVVACWSHLELIPLMRKLFIFTLNHFRFTNIFIVGINLHERKGPIASSTLKLFIVQLETLNIWQEYIITCEANNKLELIKHFKDLGLKVYHWQPTMSTLFITELLHRRICHQKASTILQAIEFSVKSGKHSTKTLSLIQDRVRFKKICKKVHSRGVKLRNVPFFLGGKLSFILFWPPLSLFLSASRAATYIFVAPIYTTTIITLEPCALNAEFQHFIPIFNKISLLCGPHSKRR